jgi:small multidrug resistance family-3 protein
MSASSTDSSPQDESPSKLFTWTPSTIALSLTLFIVAGFAEIGGGYLVWWSIRGTTSGNKQKWWLAFMGSIILVSYGFIPCLQPTDNFGRIYAVYGGFFILLSLGFGWVLDGNKPDYGDIIGTSITMVGVFLMMFWPRG